MHDIKALFRKKRVTLTKQKNRVKLKKQYESRVKARRTKLEAQGYEGDILNRRLHPYRVKEKAKLIKGIVDGYMPATMKAKRLIFDHMVQDGAIHRFSSGFNRLRVDVPLDLKRSDFVDFAIKRNLFGLFHLLKDKKGKRIFPCELIHGHNAWIDKSDKGVWRYFTQQKNGRTMGLTIFDLLEIVSGDLAAYSKNRFNLHTNPHNRVNDPIFSNAFETLAELVQAPFLITEAEEVRKYENNLRLMQNAGQALREYPALFKLIKSKLDALREIHTWGRHHAIADEWYKDGSVFFVSNRHLARLVLKHYTVVNRAINLFAVLELIHKVPTHMFSPKMTETVARIRGGNKEYKNIGLYSIPAYTSDVLERAEMLATKIKEANVRRLNSHAVSLIFGVEKATEVYAYRQADQWEFEDLG